MIVGSYITDYASKIPFLQGIPMSPFPKWQRCLGMTPFNGVVEILDRYIRVAFNVRLDKADESCLYSDFEVLKKDQDKLWKWFNVGDISEGWKELQETAEERRIDREKKNKERRERKRMQDKERLEKRKQEQQFNKKTDE